MCLYFVDMKLPLYTPHFYIIYCTLTFFVGNIHLLLHHIFIIEHAKQSPPWFMCVCLEPESIFHIL